MGDELSKLQFFIDECNKIEHIDQLKHSIRNSFRLIFPHQMAVCGIAELSPCRVVRLINIDFPAGYLQRIVRPDQTVVSTVFTAWLCNQAPTLSWLGDAASRNGNACRNAARDYKIENVASYGVIDVNAATFSYFVFGNLDTSVIDAHDRLLTAVVPHLHIALVRALTRHYVKEIHHNESHGDDAGPSTRGKDAIRTTERERQILQWISVGKSNREIAALLNISEFTVKTHVQNLLAKLSVTSRAQAVRKAMVARLIGTE